MLYFSYIEQIDSFKNKFSIIYRYVSGTKMKEKDSLMSDNICQ